MKRAALNLRDLQLQLPPVKKDTGSQPEAEKQTIRYNHRSQQAEAEITIVDIHQFGFRSCFKSTLKRENILVASVAKDSVEKPMRPWTPPRWYVFKSRGVPYAYEIVHVSWEPNYQKHFLPKEKTKPQKELYQKVRSQLFYLNSYLCRLSITAQAASIITSRDTITTRIYQTHNAEIFYV